MELIESKHAARRRLDEARSAGETVGLVPTMGALHAGHLSLVDRARAENGFVAVTIFVNPTQFGDASDLASYPRTIRTDLEMLAGAGVDVVVAPPVDDIYPTGPPETSVVPGVLASTLEGASRPGHFAGVATVVTKWFAIAGRCRAYFGEKDYQQLAVVRQLVTDLDLDVEVLGCPTVREPDGLAMSSRNHRLSPEQRRAALSLWESLDAGRTLIAGGERSGALVERAMAGRLGAEPLVTPDYAVVADSATLSRVTEIAGEVRLLVAARVGPVRLIDNLAAVPR